MGKLLNQINSPADLKKLPKSALPQLCDEIRESLVETVSQTGGHLSPNLGVVELTVALHYVFDCPRDSIVFDVGHQCYTHKLLTGRRAQFATLRQENGLSGFPRRTESLCDVFNCGHSSTSISSALGIAEARQLQGVPSHVIAVMGDGALTGGLAYEGLNNAGRFRGGFIVVLNDNKMSINRNVGAMARYLAVIRTKKGYRRVKNRLETALLHIPIVGHPLRNAVAHIKGALKNAIYHSNIFEDMGFHYIGPLDGHDLPTLIRAFELAKKENYPILIHACTQKGKGYSFAEKNPRAFHGIGGFDIETGEKQLSGESFSDFFGKLICKMAAENDRICAVTAAMKSGTALDCFAQQFPTRFFDVGIAEEHAVTFSSGLAAAGMVPVFAVYSTFLQRSYDQLIHDVAMQRLKVVLAIDRAGFVGDDGESHQGLFDCAFLSSIPGFEIYSPTYFDELENMLRYAVNEALGPCAVRYPRGLEPQKPDFAALSGGKASFDWLPGGKSITLVTYGREFVEVAEAARALSVRGIAVSLLKLNRVCPIDEFAVHTVLQSEWIYFFEEGVRSGGIGEHFGDALTQNGYCGHYVLRAVPDRFVPQAGIDRQYEMNQLDARSIVQLVSLEC